MKNSNAKELSLSAELARSKMPLLPSERSFGGFDHTMVTIGWSIATWLFVTGCWIGMAAPAPLAIIGSFFGVTVTMLFFSLLGVYHCRWGFDQAIGLRSTFGPLGTKILLLSVGLPVYWGWACLPAIMFGRATSVIVEAGNWTISPHWMILAFVCVAIGLFITYRGEVWMAWAFRIAAPLMILLIVLITYTMIKHYSFSGLMSMLPVGLHENSFLSFIIVVEISVGITFSFLFNFAALPRLCKTEGAAYYGTFLGWGFLWTALLIPGILAGLAAGVTDPVEALVAIGGAGTILYLVLLVLANPSSCVCMFYFISLSLRAMFPKLKWTNAVLINLLVLPLIIFPAVYERFDMFITLIAAVYGPLGGVWIYDIFVLRRLKVNMQEIYDESPKGAYFYNKGINIWAFVSALCGVVFSLMIYNPLTAEVFVPSVFKIIGAGIPASVFAVIVYAVLSKMFLLPAKKGFPEIPAAVSKKPVNL